MRILVITNFYPPYGLGGQEESCQQVVEGLRQRGHTVQVLTSMHGTGNKAVEEEGVHRALFLEMDFLPWQHSLLFFTHRRRREKENQRRLEQLLHNFEPDLLFIWSMWNLPRSLPALAEALYPGRILYRFAEYWPTLPSQHELYWRAPGRTWSSSLLKKLLRPLALALLAREKAPPALKFEQAICVSAATRDQLVADGLPLANARIVHTGIACEPLLNHPPANREEKALKLLYAGRLSADKGIETAVQAVDTLVHEQAMDQVHLTIAGSGDAPYEKQLQALVAQLKLEPYVSFLGRLPFEQMPGLMQQNDILLVPSLWPEPFARVVLEGMLSGLVVVATPMGGTSEIIVDDHNGLLFAPGDTAELAQQVSRLAGDAPLRRRLAQAGQETVRERFTERRMLDQIEHALRQAAGLETAVVPGENPGRHQDTAGTATQPTASVIIPTFNRYQWLRETLDSLARQNGPANQFEVIVVDDGSTDETPSIINLSFPFPLRYIRQANQGDAAARNTGARASEADILIFVDDDILLEPDYVTHIIAQHLPHSQSIVVGTAHLWLHDSHPLAGATTAQVEKSNGSVSLPFAEVCSNNMSVSREAYFALGMMHGLDFPGSDIWCDVDFSYRAYSRGFSFRRSTGAICWHRDYAARGIESKRIRIQKAAYRAVPLFRQHPGLVAHLPMFSEDRKSVV